MNILVFSTVFYPAIGGIENQTLILINEFIKKGHTVKVITYQKKKATLPGVEICYAPNYYRFLQLYYWCDTFYMPNISLKGIWLRLLNPQKKWVISHNDFHFFHKNNISSKLKNFFTKFASQNIAVSRSIASGLETKSVVIQNCYDESIFKIYPEEKREFDFVFLGRLVSQKGCDLLINACKELKQPFTLGIIGIGAEQHRLKKMVEDLGLQDSVKFWGLLRNAELAHVLNRYRTMIIPSIKEEGFGMVSLEGFACGCRIIAANAAGLSDAIDVYGEKFEMGDLYGLTNLLKKDIQNNTAEPNVNEGLTAYLKKHHKEQVAERYLELFTST